MRRRYFILPYGKRLRVVDTHQLSNLCKTTVSKVGAYYSVRRRLKWQTSGVSFRLLTRVNLDEGWVSLWCLSSIIFRLIIKDVLSKV